MPRRDSEAPPARMAAPPPAPPPPPSEDPPPEPRSFGFLLRGSLDFGGDDMHTTQPTSGGSGFTMTAGELLSFNLGAIYQPPQPFVVEATIGVKAGAAPTSAGGTISFTRYPLDVIISGALGNTRLGLGATVHFSPTYTCQASGECNTTVMFNDAFGAIIQVAHLFRGDRGNRGLDLGFRYTFIKYFVQNATVPTADVDGSGLSLFIGARL